MGVSGRQSAGHVLNIGAQAAACLLLAAALTSACLFPCGAFANVDVATSEPASVQAETEPGDDGVSTDGSASDGASEGTETNKTAKAAKKAKKKAGNLDKYIGLKACFWVLATSKKVTKIYKKKSTASTVKAKLKRNNSIVVITKSLKKGKNYKWVKVDLELGSGFVQVKKVKFATLDTKTFGLDKSVKKNRTRIKICKYGLPYLGTEFVMGGMSLKYGIDCSGFARKAMWHAGVSVGSWPLAADLARKGKPVKRKNMKPGDMVFYRTHSSSGISHCAIYLGNGFIINASGHQGHYYPLGGMRITKINYRTPKPTVFRNLVGN